MIVHLLTLGSGCSEKCSSRKDQVLSLLIIFYVYKEVFLFGSDCCKNVCNVFVAEKLKYLNGLFAYRIHRTKERCLLIKCLSAV